MIPTSTKGAHLRQVARHRWLRARDAARSLGIMTRRALARASGGRPETVAGTGEGAAGSIAHLPALLVAHHVIPASAMHATCIARLVQSVSPSLHSFLAFPFLAMCAASVPITEGLMNLDLRSLLASSLPTYQSIRDLTIRPLRRRPGSRHVFACKLVVGNQQTGKRNIIELIGKRDTTRAAGKAAKEYEAMRLLWDAGFGQHTTLKIPQPLLHLEDLQLIVQEKARGVKFRTFLGEGNDASFDQSRMVGVWLAKMHSLPVSPRQICTYTSEKASLHTFVDALCSAQRHLRPELQCYAERLEQMFDRFTDIPATWLHGDFHPDHIFIERDKVTVIDFERFTVGDSARDLGSFIAHMRTSACLSRKPIEATDQEIEIFLRSYYSNVPLQHGIAVSSRLAPFVLLSGLEALYYVACVLRVTQPSRIAMYVKCLRQVGLPLTESRLDRVADVQSVTQIRRIEGGIRG